MPFHCDRVHRFLLDVGRLGLRLERTAPPPAPGRYSLWHDNDVLAVADTVAELAERYYSGMHWPFRTTWDPLRGKAVPVCLAVRKTA
jgi:hypothetical protein